MNCAYKFRIYPNKKQEKQIVQSFGCARFIFNRILELSIINIYMMNINIKFLIKIIIYYMKNLIQMMKPKNIVLMAINIQKKNVIIRKNYIQMNLFIFSKGLTF